MDFQIRNNTLFSNGLIRIGVELTDFLSLFLVKCNQSLWWFLWELELIASNLIVVKVVNFEFVYGMCLCVFLTIVEQVYLSKFAPK